MKNKKPLCFSSGFNSTTINTANPINEKLLTLINIFTQRVLTYHQEGELFNLKHNNLLSSNAKILAMFMKMQQNPKENNNNYLITYQDIMDAFNGKK